MHGKVVATLEDKCRAVRAIQLGYRLAPNDPTWVARDGDDVFEDNVLGQQVEEMVTIDQPRHALLDDPEERIQGLEVPKVADRRHRASSTAHAAAVRHANSAKVAGRAPVTLSTSLLGSEPCPDAIVSVSMRRTAP